MINDFNVGWDFRLSSIYSTLEISTDLTEKGSKNIDKVLEAIFSYLLLMKEKGLDEKILDYLKRKRDIAFRLHSEIDSSDNVIDTASAMLLFPPKDILTGTKMIIKYDLKFLESVIEILNERKFNLTYFSTDFRDFDKKEKWTGLEYAEFGNHFYILK